MFPDTVSLAQLRGRGDEDVRADVCNRLWDDDTTRASERSALAVEVRDGQVFLVGHVTDRPYSRHVVELIRSVRGAKAIHNALVADPDLVREVAQALATDTRTRPSVIQVGAFHGWIHLAGEVPDLATRLAAEQVAAGVAHVRGVLALPHLPQEPAAHGEKRRPLQPRVGQAVYASDGPAGLVEQVVICPDSRLVSHIVVAGSLEVNWQPIRGHWVVPVEAIKYANEGGVFLSDRLSALAARTAYRTADVRWPPPDWQLPFPYTVGEVRWLAQPDATPVVFPIDESFWVSRLNRPAAGILSLWSSQSYPRRARGSAGSPGASLVTAYRSHVWPVP